MITKQEQSLLKVENLSVRFATKEKGMFGHKSYLQAVDNISFDIKKGQTLGIVGESGSGKSTAVLAVARLVKSHSGTISLSNQNFGNLQGEALRKMRRKMQFMFQDPYSSLNPRLRAKSIVQEPLDSLTKKSKEEKQLIIDQLFTSVGLRKEQQELFPHQFSGGQRQRIGIARALSTQPELIICDEPVSALDVAVQAQILNLLRKLQEERGLAYLFISHDLGVVQHMCDMIAVMYMGKIVEYADRLSLFNHPQHPYTQALLSAVPSIDRSKVKQRILIEGVTPDAAPLSKGCRFASRCPKVNAACREKAPQLDSLSVTHRVACHEV